MDRRRLITLSGAFAASCAIGSRFGYATGGYPFTLGVASGQPFPDGFVLWTRLALEPLASDGHGGMSDPISVTWEIATDDQMRKVIRRGMAEAHSQWAHSIHVELGGLAPARPYWYRFTALGERSQIGLVHTAPSPDAQLEQFRFAFASCSQTRRRSGRGVILPPGLGSSRGKIQPGVNRS
jgi:alkaline phosphatase D